MSQLQEKVAAHRYQPIPWGQYERNDCNECGVIQQLSKSWPNRCSATGGVYEFPTWADARGTPLAVRWAWILRICFGP